MRENGLRLRLIVGLVRLGTFPGRFKSIGLSTTGMGSSQATGSLGLIPAAEMSEVLRKTFLDPGFNSTRGLTCLGFAVSDDVVEVLRVFLSARA